MAAAHEQSLLPEVRSTHYGVLYFPCQIINAQHLVECPGVDNVIVFIYLDVSLGGSLLQQARDPLAVLQVETSPPLSVSLPPLL